MALSIAEANTVSSNYFDPTITSQVYEQSPYYSKLKQKNKIAVNGGVQIQWPIRYTKLNTTQAVGPRQQIAYQAVQTRTAAVLSYAYYVGNALMSWDERVQNTGKAEIVNLMKDKTEELTSDIYEKFATDLFATTQGTNSFQSIDTIINTASYAGISSTDATPWTSQVDTSTTRLTLYGSSGSLAHMINLCTFGKSMPSMIVTTRDLYNKAESLVEPQKRYEDTSSGDMGFTTVMFHGIPIFGDVFCTTKYMYLIDVEQFEIRYHPDYNFAVTPWDDLKQAGFPNALAKTVSWAGNHVCRMRQTSGKYTQLDYTL